MTEEILFRYNPWWSEKYALENVHKRTVLLDILKNSLSSRQIVFITGLRRVGKTTLMKLLIKHLIKNENINPRHIFYLSLDDYSLANRNILELVDEFRKVQKLQFEKKIYLFLDEIAYQKDFEIQLKNLYDSQNVKIYTSSSSASILKSKKPYLTGRNIIIEMLPLDFKEYLQFKNIKIKKSDHHLTEKYFEEYLEIGGMPEYVLDGNIEHLKELVDDILHKDIASLYGVKDIQTLKDFFLLLMERAGKVVSINKMAHILNIAPDTAMRYLKMFENSYLVDLVSRCGKTNERILSAKKIYAADLGIRVLFTGFRDKGSLFENYVYLKIKHKKPCYVYQDKNEIDFFTEDKTLIEVKYKKEIEGKQKELFDTFPAKEKMIINGVFDLKKLD